MFADACMEERLAIVCQAGPDVAVLGLGAVFAILLELRLAADKGTPSWQGRLAGPRQE